MLIRFAVLFKVAVFVCIFAISPTNGQTTDAAGDPVSEKINELAGQLTDDQSAALVRMMELLTEENQVMSQPSVDTPGIGEIIRSSILSFRSKISYHSTRIPIVFSGIGESLRRTATDQQGGAVQFFGLFVLVLAAGVAANYFVKWVARRTREKIEVSDAKTLPDQLRTLTLRFGLELSGLIALVVVSIVAAGLIVSDPVSRTIVVSFILTVVMITWLMGSCLKFVLAPERPDLRLVTADDATAHFLYRSLVAIAVLIGTALFVLGLLQRYSLPVVDSFRFWVALLVILWVAYVIWRSRNGLTSIIKGNEEILTPGLERMAAWWPVVSIILVMFIWIYNQFVIGDFQEAVSPVRGILALAIVVLAPFLDTMQRGIIRHAMPAMQGEGPVAEEAYIQTRLSYIRIGRVALFAILILVLGRLLGISFQNVAEAGLGAQIAANGVQAVLVLAIGYVAWETANLWVNRQLARETPIEAEGGTDSEGGGGESKSRMASVLPLIHMTLQITIAVITLLLVLSQLGFDITPLLAGAGVLGLAIGFGAQTLVKDVVSGVFFLLDDAFRIGEFLEIDATTGSVEKISVRSLQLRGVNGPVHIVPYGTIDKLTNHSRDWVIMKLNFTVPFDTDIDKVRKLFKKIGQQIMENPDLAKDILQPFKSQGVNRVDDVGLVIRGKFMAKPGTQWVLRKEIYTRVQKAFDENDIQFARKEVRVQVAGLKNDESLTPEQENIVAAAAAEAAEPEPTKS
ncbi:MAG: mechanosensitive ion channel family protein [Rhizobiaceae bacterium]